MARDIVWRLKADSSDLRAGIREAKSELGALGAEIGKIEAGIAKSGSAFSGFARAGTAAFAAVGAAAAGAVASILRLADAGGKLADLEAKSGIAAEGLQKLGYAGKLVGVELTSITSAAVKMQKGIIDGNQAFAQLGLSVQALRAMKPEDQFAAAAGAINKLGSDTEKAAAAMAVFGKGGAEILPLIKSNLQGAAAEAERLGLVLDEKTVAAADALGDSLDKGGMALGAVAAQFAGAIITTSGFQEAVDGVVHDLADLGSWVTAHKGDIQTWVQDLLVDWGLLRDTIRDAAGYWSSVATGSGGRLPGAAKAPEQTMQFEEFFPGQGKPGAFKGAADLAAAEAGRKAAAAMADAWRDGLRDHEDAMAEALSGVLKRAEVKAGSDVRLAGAAPLFGADGAPGLLGIGTQTVSDADMARAVAGIQAGVNAAAAAHLAFVTKAAADAAKWKITWQDGLRSVVAGFQDLGGRVGGILAGITSSVLQAGSALKGLHLTGEGGGFSLTGKGGGIGGFLSNLGGVMSIAGAGIGILKGIGHIFGFGGKPKEPPPPTWEEKWKLAIDNVGKLGLAAGATVLTLLASSGQAGQRKPEAQAFVNQQLGRAASALPAIGGLAINTQASAQAQATIFSATFWGIVKEQGLVAGVDALSAPFAALKDKLSAGGFDVNALLGGIGGLFDAVEGPARAALEAADGLNQALQGVALAGYLTQDSFSAFGVAAADAFAQAVAGGLTQQQALVAIGPLLGNISQASATYGLAIDANTQALLDQARAAGVAFPTDPIDRLVGALDRLVKVLGGDVPAAAAQAGSALEQLGNVNIGSPHFGGAGAGEGEPDYSAAGGMQVASLPRTRRPGGVSMIVAHPGESVSIGRGGGGASITFAPVIQGGSGGREMLRQLIDWLRQNTDGLASEIDQALPSR